MRAHALMGERGAALDAYHRCASTLSRELGVAPSAETQRLHEEVVLADGPILAGRAGIEAGSTARSPPLVGRRDELASPWGAWVRASGGFASTVLVRATPASGRRAW